MELKTESSAYSVKEVTMKSVQMEIVKESDEDCRRTYIRGLIDYKIHVEKHSEYFA